MGTLRKDERHQPEPALVASAGDVSYSFQDALLLNGILTGTGRSIFLRLFLISVQGDRPSKGSELSFTNG